MQETAETEQSRFVELPALSERKDIVATVRIGRAALDVYSGASAEVVTAICKAIGKLKNPVAKDCSRG